MKVATVDKGQGNAVEVRHKVVFNLTPAEEVEYSDACALLRGVANEVLRELETSYDGSDFTSITSEVKDGQLVVKVHQGAIG